MKNNKNYGKELILDLHNCDNAKFTRYYINKYFKELCNRIDMEACKIAWWDYKGYPDEYEKAPKHLKGTSAIQFISTSNITIHTLDEMNRVYLNIFSCKDFDADNAMNFTKDYFNGNIVNKQTVSRI